MFMVMKQTIRSVILPLVFLIVGILSTFWPTISSSFRLMQTDPGDTRFNNYILEHEYQFMRGNPFHADFWSPPMFWPQKNTLAYSDLLIGVAPFYWIFRVFRFAPDTSYQLWMIFMAALDYISTYVLFRKVVRYSVIASTGGAFLFAFAAVRINQLSHHQLLPQFYSIIMMICLIEYGKGIGMKNRNTFVLLAGATISIVLQLYSGYYLGWFLCFGSGLFLIISCLFKDSRQFILQLIRQDSLLLLIIIVSFGLLCLPMLFHYSAAMTVIYPRSQKELTALLPRFLSYTDMGYTNFAFGWTHSVIDYSRLEFEGEHRLGIGLITFIVVILGWWWSFRNIWSRNLTLVSVLLFFFSIYYTPGITPWIWIWKHIPGAYGIGAVSRIIFLLLIPVSLGVGAALNRLKKVSLSALLLLLLVLEQQVTTKSYDKYVVRERVRSVTDVINQSCRGFFFMRNNPPSGSYVTQLDAMWAGLLVNKPTINGYSGNGPSMWGLDFPDADPAVVKDRYALAFHEWLRFNGLPADQICYIYSESELTPEDL